MLVYSENARRYASKCPGSYLTLPTYQNVFDTRHHHCLLQLFKGDSSGSYSRQLVRDSLCRRGLFKATIIHHRHHYYQSKYIHIERRFY